MGGTEILGYNNYKVGDYMCGRLLLNTSIEDLREYYNIVKEVEEKRQQNYNYKKGEVFPSDISIVLHNKELKALSWGFPAKDKLMINGRCETIFERPMFAQAMEQSRCLVPVNSFYEWKEGSKHSISIKGTAIFSLGGIVKKCIMKDGTVADRFLILTTEANEEMKSLHHRMPLIIEKSLQEEFLNPWTKKQRIKEMLEPYSKNKLFIESLSDVQQLSLF